jgi:hypothetical protein
MSRARGLLVLTIVSSAAACTLSLPLDGLTGGGGDGGATNDVAADMTVKDAGDAGNGDGPSAEGPAGDASPDAVDGGTAVDANDGGPAGDVVQPDVVTGPVSCADAGVLLCEDFENGLDTTKWPSSDSVHATAVIDGTQHHRGAYALHANMPGLSTGGGAVNVQGDINHLAPLPSPVFIRAFVMFSSALPQSVESFLVAQSTQSPYYGLQIELWPQNGNYGVTDWTSSPVLNVSNGPPATAATWNCLEWELDPPASGTTTTNADFWLDGGEVSSLHLNVAMTNLGQLTFGMGFYQVTTLPAYDMWIDDIYVDTSRVGCDK